MRPGGGRPGPRLTEKPKNTKKTLKRLLSYIGKSRRTLMLLLLVMVISTLFTLVAPMLQGSAIDAIEPVKVADMGGEEVFVFRRDGVDLVLSSDGRELGRLDGGAFDHLDFHIRFAVHWGRENYVSREGVTPGLSFFLIAMGTAALFGALFNFWMQRLAAKLSQYTVYTMRRELFDRIAVLPIRYTDTHRHGDLMSRMTGDVENVSTAISQSVASLFSAVLTIVGALVFMLLLSPILTLVALFTIPLSIFVTTFLSKFMRKYFVRQQKLLGSLNGQVEEMVTSYKTVVAYGKEDDAVRTFAHISGELKICAIKAKVWGSIMGPVMNFIGNLQYVLIAATGGALYLFFGIGTIGTIQSMLQYSKNFTRPINEVASQFSSILTALAAAERIFDVLDSEPEIDRGKREPEIVGNLSFRDIHFGYEKDEPVLRGFDLEVKAGEKIAIVGATGSGKTTVINLLTRFYEPDSGEILVDGVPICEIPKAYLRRHIGIVLQDTVLFCDTVEKNILYGNSEADGEDVKKAAAMAKADVFVERLPEGYKTELAEGGSNLSAGQRQLLAITRAIIADPKILILDEATSNVDTRTEMNIQTALIRLMKNRTSLIIAHRLSTIRDADKIVVIKGGRVAEIGDHDALLALDGEYAKLYQSQFAGIVT